MLQSILLFSSICVCRYNVSLLKLPNLMLMHFYQFAIFRIKLELVNCELFNIGVNKSKKRCQSPIVSWHSMKR